VQFKVLGPLQVTTGDFCGSSTVATARLRVLLAALLWRPNQPMPADEIAELVWDGAPPSGAPDAIRTLVMRLRRRLDTPAAARIVTRSPGYAIEISDDELDASLFETLTRQSGTAVRAEQWAETARTAAEALALWRGTALADIPSQLLRDRWVPHLDQLHVQAVEWRIEADLHAGRHEQLIPQLRELTAQHPVREHFHGQLMLALYRCGRQAEALAAYQHARRTLIDELGIEPGPGLRDLHKRILAGDTELLLPHSPPLSEGTSLSARPPSVPRQLPATVRHFVGRAAELKSLSELLTQQTETGGAVVISAIGGTAGIGKTALAVHWAHQYCDRFPDGQLYVNLRGFDPAGTPLPPADAVRRFLTALGVPAQRIPADPDEQTALYRSELAGRQVLIVLDNARDAEQVRPLLPGAPGCLVLITSRSQLASLIAFEGAAPLTLDLLAHDEARDLLVRRLGRERVAADDQAADDLIQACTRLPLALNMAAASAELRPGHPLSALVDKLRDARRPLDGLAMQDGAADLRAVFSWSYHALAPEAARVFRLLGLHPGPDISLEATASLTALELDHARRALDALTAAHLISEHSPGRYTCHDLLRAYAAEQARAHDTDTQQQDALRRVCDHYLHTAHGADRLLHPHRPLLRLDPPARGTRPQHLNDITTALAWFDTEHSNLLAAQRTAAVLAWHSVIWQLAWTLSTFHVRRGRRHDELAAWKDALEGASRHRDLVAPALIHRCLGRAYADLNCHTEAIGHLYHALTLAEIHQDLTEQAHGHRALAWAWERGGDFRRELAHATRALDLYRAVNQEEWEADALHMVGWCTARLGNYDAARAHCETALSVHRKHHYPTGESDTLNSLGYIEHHTGHHQQAIDHYQQALALRRTIGNTYQSADTLDHLGHPHAALGQHEQARTIWRQALDLYQQQGRSQDAQRVQHKLNALSA
jgi:DNA-binding SARP family transcriptional activator